jgi:hypothetical protein
MLRCSSQKSLTCLFGNGIMRIDLARLVAQHSLISWHAVLMNSQYMGAFMKVMF